MGFLNSEQGSLTGPLWVATAGAAAATAWWWIRRRRRHQKQGQVTNGSARLATIEFRQHQRRRNRRALKVLVAWALTNIAVGALGRQNSGGKNRDFYEMNIAWNGVNLLIAMLANRRWPPQGPDEIVEEGAPAALQEARKTERLLMTTATMDAVTIAGGAMMWRRGAQDGSSTMVGYGQSLIVQGAFLLGFDSIWLVAGKRHRRRFQDKLAPTLWSEEPQGALPAL